MSDYNLCECSDPACPACKGGCKCVARTVLYRVDMEDETGTAFCNMCADDAMKHGLLTDSKEEEAEDIDPAYCPVCDGEGEYIGALGWNGYFRCIQCGADFSRSLK